MQEMHMNKFLMVATIAAATAFVPAAANAQIAVDTPVGGVRIGEPRHDYHPHYGYRSTYRSHDAPVVERRVYRDRAVRLGGSCRTVTIERDDGSVKRIRRCE
jgi:hypothetical protein